MSTDHENNCIGANNMVTHIRKQCIPNFILAGYHCKTQVIVTDLDLSKITLPSGYHYTSKRDGEFITNKGTSNPFEEIKIIRTNKLF
jgi:hypothetical protein